MGKRLVLTHIMRCVMVIFFSDEQHQGSARLRVQSWESEVTADLHDKSGQQGTELAANRGLSNGGETRIPPVIVNRPTISRGAS